MSTETAAAGDAPEVTEPHTEEMRKLRAQVLQLKNIIKKLTGQSEGDNGEGSNGDSSSEGGGRRSKKKGKARNFDFALYKKRHVSFKVAYFGWDYHGFAVQEITGKTIESELFRALTLTRLIESRETSNYHRCGRTDKGVSAFSQVVSIDVRTNRMEGGGVFEQEGCRAGERIRTDDAEIDYCKLLNANLPETIQVVAWAPCPSREFSARFDCKSRTYKYFFPRGELNMAAMNEAGEKLVGEHDFRNFCKMDVNNGVVNYMRRIDRVHAELTPTSSGDDPYAMCEMTVVGKAFLWHQIRCIVAVLFRIGEGKEAPDVIDKLLDVEENPCRPQYVMASEVPLNLFDCAFESDALEWQYDQESLGYVIRRFQALWTEHQVKASMLRAALKSLEAETRKRGFPPVTDQVACLIPKGRSKTYVPLMDMLKCPSLQQKISHTEAKKRRLEGPGETNDACIYE